MNYRSLRIRASVALVALLLGSSLALVSPQPAAAAERCFPETGQCLDGAFLDYWQNRGGLELLGFPISAQFVEVSPTDGKPYTVQYTERTRLEYHPELVGTPYVVLAGLLGREQMLAKYPTGTPTGMSAPGGLSFPETGKSLSPDFAAWWTSHGGLELVGYPLSDEFVEISPTNGQPYTVQYTERTRLERHPENAPPYNVLAGLLGREQYLAKYGSGTWGPTLAPLVGGKNYAEPSGYFTFSVPLNWTQAADPGAYRVVFAAPGNAASVGILAAAAPAGYTLDQLDHDMLALVQAEPNYTAVLHDKVTVNGLRAYRHIYTRTLGGVPIGVELVYLLGPGNKVAYGVQMGSAVAAFPTLQPTFDAIAGSFKALK